MNKIENVLLSLCCLLIALCIVFGFIDISEKDTQVVIFLLLCDLFLKRGRGIGDE